jgi:hypothetical protein
MMVETLDSSDSANGIKGGVDSDDRSTFDNAREDVVVDLDDSVEEDGNKSPTLAMPIKELPRKSAHMPTAPSGIVSKREMLIDIELENARLRQELLKHKIHYKQLQIAQLEQQQPPAKESEYEHEQDFESC